MNMIQQFDENGYVVLEQLLTPRQLQQITKPLTALAMTTAGSRELLSEAWCQRLASELKLNEQLISILPINPVAIQCTFFKKSADKNWLVPLHQDLSISVKQRLDRQGFTGWSAKQTMLFVQPPADILAQIVAVRLHIDDCFAEHGPLKVVAGSHRQGRIPEKEWPAIRDLQGEQSCITAKGGAVIMRPLLLHSSSKAIQANGRRVLHFLFAPKTLANEIPFLFDV